MKDKKSQPAMHFTVYCGLVLSLLRHLQWPLITLVTFMLFIISVQMLLDEMLLRRMIRGIYGWKRRMTILRSSFIKATVIPAALDWLDTKNQAITHPQISHIIE